MSTIAFKRFAPAIVLFILSPFIAEFLLGNIGIDAIENYIFLAPLYGGGALLVREIARRSGRGWPAILLLGLAFAIVEEGLITQTLFNPSYFRHELLSAAYIPALGIGVWWTMFVLTLHTVWSISISIALVESFVPKYRTEPWLGKIGIATACILFLLGSIMNFYGTYLQEAFLASIEQLSGVVIATAIVVATSFVATGRMQSNEIKDNAPSPWMVGLFSFSVSSLFMLGGFFPGWMFTIIWIVLIVTACIVISRWSEMNGWKPIHIAALASGALITYIWNSFFQKPVLGTAGIIDTIGNIIFALIALMCIYTAIKLSQRSIT
ncbi:MULTISPECIES: hypothetical protein [Paenibacillus]|uniref:hypothetical protein n=1 Tax=Paenibacillus TaxID=44249 RepID=UPI0011A72AFB|nr:hypothetical protein [Paenibacillus sp. IHBB 10380]